MRDRIWIAFVLPAFLVSVACGPGSQSESEGSAPAPAATAQKSAPADGQAMKELIYWPEEAGPRRDLDADIRTCQERVQESYPDDAGAQFIHALGCLGEFGWKAHKKE